MNKYKYDFYLCGPMTGCPGYNHSLFNKLEDILSNMGYIIFNPARVNGIDKPYAECMTKDLNSIINECRGIAIMPGWRKSKGANVEVFVGYVCDKELVEIHIKKNDTVRLLPLVGEPKQLPYDIPMFFR